MKIARIEAMRLRLPEGAAPPAGRSPLDDADD